MIDFLHLDQSRIFAPRTEMYAVPDPAKLDEGIAHLCTVIQEFDYSGLEHFFEMQEQAHFAGAQRREWEISKKRWDRFVGDIQSIGGHFDQDEWLGLSKKVGERYQSTLQVPALPFAGAHGAIRQVKRAIDYPDYFSDSLREMYAEWLVDSLKELVKGPPFANDHTLDGENVVKIVNFIRDGEIVDPESLRQLSRQELDEVELETSRGTEKLWFGGMSFYPGMWTRSVIELCIGPMEQSFGSSYFCRPALGAPVIPTSLIPCPVFLIAYPQYQKQAKENDGSHWSRIRNAEIESLLKWAREAEVTSPCWWPDPNAEFAQDYRWEPESTKDWPEIKERMIAGCERAKREGADIVWRIDYPEACEF